MQKIFSSQNFLLLTCAAIFLLSIFFRSTIDIGPDTGFYLDLGRRVAEGKKYYYDFFESNFPLSFYFYALQYRISVLSGINPIIMSEIFINLLAVWSILFSAKILRKSSIYHERRDYYNIIIIGFCLGFFLRIGALQVGEFGTKSSLLLILLYPYIAYSLLEKAKLTQKDLIYRGLLMGLMPCLKPHYAIIIIVIELSRFWQNKSPRFFIELDKLVALVVMVFYLNFMIKFTPEFIEFMIPMWRQFYTPYSDIGNFFDNILNHILIKTLLLSLIIPIFLRLKFAAIDKILALSFVGATILLALENVGTIDQEAVFYAIATICLLKFSYDFFTSKYFSFQENKFIILTLIFIPIFDIENFFKALFNLINIWFIVVPLIFIFSKKQYSVFIANLPLYFVLTVISLIVFSQNNENLISVFGLSSFLIFLFLYEKSYTKLYNKFSLPLIFVATSIFSYFAYLYIGSITNVSMKKSYFSSPSQLSDEMVYNINKYAPKSEDSYLVVSNWISHQFPLMNYLNKTNYYKYAIAMVYDERGAESHTMSFVGIPDRAFVFGYLFDDLKRQIQNPNTKIIFVNQSYGVIKLDNKCTIGLLEYYLHDPAFRKIFSDNFRFENRIIEVDDVEAAPKIRWKKGDVFDKIEPSNRKILRDFEVYVRK